VNSKRIEITPIGYVRRTSSKEDVKDKNLVSKVILRKDLTEALDGVEGFSHLFIIFWMHEISDAEKTPAKVHPRGRPELPLVGMFATRTPNRPNPVGLTLVELVKREKNILWVRGLDAFHGTPIVDIKPYDRWDAKTNARVPEWLKAIGLNF
jgi:tRNA-Thr(GGU) m(6)t(6)A37 methyltransferase TsaA